MSTGRKRTNGPSSRFLVFLSMLSLLSGSPFLFASAWQGLPIRSYTIRPCHYRTSGTIKKQCLSTISRSKHIPHFSRTNPLNALPIPTSANTSPLWNYFLETVIAQGVPALFWILVIAFAAKSFSKKGTNARDDSLFGANVVDELYDDLYDNDNTSSSSNMVSNLFSSFRKAKNTVPTKNVGIPSETFLTLTPLNTMYQSYQYSFTAATQSKAKAAAILRKQNFERALQKAVDSSIQPLTVAESVDLYTEEKAFLKRGKEVMDAIQLLQQKLTKQVIERSMEDMDVQVGEVDPHPMDNDKNNEKKHMEQQHQQHQQQQEEESWWKQGWNRIFPSKQDVEMEKWMTQLEEETSELVRLELEFIKTVVDILGPDRANGIRAALLGNIQGGNAAMAGTLLRNLQERPLSSILKSLGYSEDKIQRKRLFVTDFTGDVTASQVDFLREEVTGILRSAQPGDEVLLLLQTGGGTVTGYGLGAAQLERFKKQGIKLTVCVEQVAASGGYLMSCVADKIIASPFAVLGSIGVVAEMPNIYDRLKREGIEFQTVTAGKYKRTLTPTKKVTKEDFEKEQQELEEVLTLFKNFVKRNRPSLDIDAVATGETWFGEDALNRGLCDELRTVDDVLIEYIDSDYDVYQVRYEPPLEESSLSNLLPIGTSKSKRSMKRSTEKRNGIVSNIIRGFISMVKEEIMIELDDSYAIRNRDENHTARYLLHDGDVSRNLKSEI